MPDMSGKVVIITGSTSGLGLEAAREIATMGATVVIHGRSSEKIESAIVSIKNSFPQAKLNKFCSDLSILTETKFLADYLIGRYEQINVLINNAAISMQNPSISSEQLDKAFVTNHLSHFYLTNRLLKTLVSSKARIINVTSCDHFSATFDQNDLQCLHLYGFNRAYSKTKLYNVMFTYELAKRLANTGTTCNCIHPGRIRTGIGRNDTNLFRIAKDVLDYFDSISLEEGASGIVSLATSPELEGITGKYYDKTRIASSSAGSYNEHDWKTLWQMSENLCKIHIGGDIND